MVWWYVCWFSRFSWVFVFIFMSVFSFYSLFFFFSRIYNCNRTSVPLFTLSYKCIFSFQKSVNTLKFWICFSIVYNLCLEKLTFQIISNLSFSIFCYYFFLRNIFSLIYKTKSSCSELKDFDFRFCCCCCWSFFN